MNIIKRKIKIKNVKKKKKWCVVNKKNYNKFLI